MGIGPFTRSWSEDRVFSSVKDRAVPLVIYYWIIGIIQWLDFYMFYSYSIHCVTILMLFKTCFIVYKVTMLDPGGTKHGSRKCSVTLFSAVFIIGFMDLLNISREASIYILLTFSSQDV